MSDSEHESQKPEEALDEFRNQWKSELHQTQKENPISNFDDVRIADDTEERATKLFLEGVDLEKRGRVFEAMKLYRRSMQLVPNIEFKIYELSKASTSAAEQAALKEKALEESQEESQADEEDLTDVDLLSRFQATVLQRGYLFQRNMSDKVISTSSSNCHFGSLPLEIILYILRWVVSSDLDVRSLDLCSEVCKGFYICSRDPELWRAACIKVWGAGLGSLEASSYPTWRDMFYERHRVLFAGCYISKTSYFRMGENNFQDHFYGPLHLVEYFRLIRFWPDGRVTMITSADDPQQSVAKLKHRFSSSTEVMNGYFRLAGSGVSIVLQPKIVQYNRPLGRRKAKVESGRTFYLEFEILSSSKRKFCKLEWRHYSVTQQGVESEFELSNSRYPSFWFSRVKSYHSEANTALL